MSLINDLRAAEQAYEASKQRLEALQSDPALAKLKEFETSLRALLGKYGMSLRDVNELLDPEYKAPSAQRAKPGKRTLRRYTNPHTGETTESLGGVNKVLAEWREKHGWDTVKTWAKVVE